MSYGVSRREFLGGVAAVCVAPEVLVAEPPPIPVDYTKLVKVAIGTGGHGHCYPGATVPFGAVQLSPDTGTRDWDHCSGYHYDDNAILGFSHTHLSGTGCIDMMDFLVMPATDDFNFDPHAEVDGKTSYRAHFSHADEVATPGYYSVSLKESRVKAELTATERAGMHRYTFPASDKSVMLVDLMHAGLNMDAKDKTKYAEPIVWASMKVIGNDTIVGGRSTDVWGRGRQIYFCMKFSKPFASVDVYSAGEKIAADGEVKGKALRAIVHFTTHANEVVHVKTGISAVDVEGATANLAAEIPGWDFDSVRRAAHASWSKELGRAKVTASNRPDSQKYLEIFYTGMYHMMLAPTLFDDVDGRYRGMDGQVHTLPRGERNYSTFSLWDTYRAAHPLYTLLFPERVPDFINCLVRMAEQSKVGVPIWPLQGAETGTMDGYHSAPVVAEAIVKGFKGIDVQRAYAVFKKRAEVDDFRGLAAYRKYGFVPCDVEIESCSKTCDYAYDAWAVAAIAKAAGDDAGATTLKKQSLNFVNVYDKQSGFIRPRYADGHWAAPFNPKSIVVTKWRDYTEANAWQTTFLVQHEPKVLIEAMGGNAAFVAKLDALFNQSSDLPPDMPPDVSGMVGQYAHGNEPSHHIAYMYNFAGAPHKTQARIRSLLETMYDNQPNGMAGNEDCGQMSAWFVISALGLYATDPVSGRYDIGTPLFDRVELSVGGGRKLIIEAKRESAASAYVQKISWNGAEVSALTVGHAEISKGGSLVFALKDKPGAVSG